MNKSNEKDSSQSIRALIETAAVKKHQELEPEPTKQDYEEATSLMVELFADTKSIYYSMDRIIPTLKLVFPNKTAFDRIGLAGIDAILSVLKEKQIVNEFHPKCVQKNSQGYIVLIDENEDQSGIFSKFIEYDSNLPVYRYATRDDLYWNKITSENNDESNEKDRNDLESPD